MGWHLAPRPIGVPWAAAWQDPFSSLFQQGHPLRGDPGLPPARPDPGQLFLRRRGCKKSIFLFTRSQPSRLFHNFEHKTFLTYIKFDDLLN